MVLSSGLGTPGGLASHPSHGPLHWGAPPRSPRHLAPSDTPHPSCRKARDTVSPLELKAHRRGTIDSQRGFQEDARPGAPAAGRAGPGPGPEGAAGQHTPPSVPPRHKPPGSACVSGAAGPRGWGSRHPHLAAPCPGAVGRTQKWLAEPRPCPPARPECVRHTPTGRGPGPSWPPCRSPPCRCRGESCRTPWPGVLRCSLTAPYRLPAVHLEVPSPGLWWPSRVGEPSNPLSPLASTIGSEAG